MVLLGGLEFVAAGYVLNEISKDKKKKIEEKERRERKHDRKHHHRHDSPHPQSPPQQDLRPPQFGPPRPYSAPPPSSHPMTQLQPPPSHPQQWQPATRPYHPIPLPQPGPNMYPPPGVHIDLKTGQVQYNMLPPDLQPHAREAPPHTHQYVSNDERVRSEPDFYAFDPRQSSGPHSAYSEQHKSYSQPQINPVASTRPGYIELNAETPGRHAPHNIKDPRSPPPAYRE